MLLTQSQASAGDSASLRRGKRIYFPLSLAVLAIVVGANSLGLGGLWVKLGPGPGFFPLVLGSLLGFLSLLWIVQELNTKPGTPPADSQAPLMAPDSVAVPQEQEVPLGWRSAAAIVGSLVVLAILMPLIGYQLSMLLFLIFHLKVLGRRRWLLTSLVSVVGSIGVFVLFTRVLTVNLPAASIEILQNLGF